MPASQMCDLVSIENTLHDKLSTAPASVDFSLLLNRSDGREFIFERGASTVNTEYESASTSKWVSAVIILRLVEKGFLKLTDKPQTWISDWPIAESDPLYNMTLQDLLSFTSGLQVEPPCLNAKTANFSSCVQSIANANTGKTIVPGSAFYYASTHLQVAGLMAIKAAGKTDWQALFSDFQTETGLFTLAEYDLPSLNNPRLAGGMHWTGREYLDFLKAFKAGQLLNAQYMDLMLTDYTATAQINYSPVTESLNEEWHYGFGLWHECQSTQFNCVAGTRMSSPGAYGAYPFWDKTADYVGMLARQGTLGSYPEGIALVRTVQRDIERWADCQ